MAILTIWKLDQRQLRPRRRPVETGNPIGDAVKGRGWANAENGGGKRIARPPAEHVAVTSGKQQNAQKIWGAAAILA